MANGGNGRARITVVGDYVCPFCYLEEPDLARVREEFGDGVEVDWRAYELRADPIPTLDPTASTCTASGTPPPTRWPARWA